MNEVSTIADKRHVGLPPFATRLRIAADLEGSAKRRELRSVAANMACGARLTCLRGEVRVLPARQGS